MTKKVSESQNVYCIKRLPTVLHQSCHLRASLTGLNTETTVTCQPNKVSVILYFRNTSFSKFSAIRWDCLSVKTAPHSERNSLDVLVAGTDSICLAISNIFGSWDFWNEKQRPSLWDGNEKTGWFSCQLRLCFFGHLYGEVLNGKELQLFGFCLGSCLVYNETVRILFGSFKDESSSSVRVRFYSRLY